MQNNNTTKALKAGLWYTISNIVLRAVSIFTAPLFTRLLTPEDYGKFNNFFSWQTILACLFGLCLNYSIGRAKIDFKNDFNGFISSIQTLSALVGLSFLILALPFLDSFSSFMEIDKGLLITLLVMLIFSPSIDYLQSYYRFEYRYRENVIIAIISTIGVVLTSVVLILMSDLKYRYAARILGGVIPTFIIALYAFVYLYLKGKKGINVEYWKYSLRFSLPMIPHGLAMVLLAQIDRIMLLKMSGEATAGLYSFGYSYAIIITVLTNAVTNAWQPWLYEKVAAGEFSQILVANKKLNMLSFVAALAFIVIGPEVIMILGSSAFYEAKWMVAPVITGCLFQFYYGYFSLMELFCKKTEFIAIGSVIAAVVKIVLNVVFIPQYGYIGAAYTTMIGYSILLFYHWSVFRHIFKETIFAEKQIFVLSILAVVMTIIFTQTYNTFVIRYALFLLTLLFLGFLYRSTMAEISKELFRRMKG